MHLHLPHLPVPLLMLSLVYAGAIAVALAHPGGPALAGLVVLAGLTARWVARHRHRAHAPAGTVAVLTPQPATPPATAA